MDDYNKARAERYWGIDEVQFNPTPEQIDVFRMVEEEAAYGNALADDQFTIRQSHVARELADLGYLDCLGDVFEITAEGQAAFADCGR